MLHHDGIAINNHLLQSMNLIICKFISVHKCTINILLVFEMCLVSHEMVYTNFQAIIFQNKILLGILLIIFRLRKINYNMLCTVSKSYNKILITWNIFEMINNIDNNNYEPTSIICV